MVRLIVSILAVGAMAASAAAQDGRPLTLDEAVARALERNPAVRAAAASGDEAQARAKQAFGGYFPRVDVVEAWQGGNQPVYVFGSLLAQRRFSAANFAIDALNHPDALSNHRAALIVQQPIFDGWSTRSSVQVARLGASAAQLEREVVAARLRVEVVTAYGRALAAATERAWAATAVQTATEDVRRAEARRDLGVETEANVLAFRVHLADAEARKVRADTGESVARATLNAAMGAPLDEAAALADLAVTPERTLDAAALESAAIEQRPELQQAHLGRQQADAARARAKSGMLPQVMVNAGAEMNGESFTDRASSWGAGLEVRWNVFAGGADKARIAEATAASARADAERARLESMVRLEVRTAIAEYRSAIAREAAGRRTVEQAHESQRIIRDRYDAGLASAGDVLRAAELVAQAESARTSAVIDVHVTAAALDRAAGGTRAVTPDTTVKQ
jgi:outer membrane protein TolC